MSEDEKERESFQRLTADLMEAKKSFILELAHSQQAEKRIEQLEKGITYYLESIEPNDEYPDYYKGSIELLEKLVNKK